MTDDELICTSDYIDLASSLEDVAEQLRMLHLIHKSSDDAGAMLQLESIANELYNRGYGDLGDRIRSAMDSIKAVRNIERQAASLTADEAHVLLDMCVAWVGDTTPTPQDESIMRKLQAMIKKSSI